MKVIVQLEEEMKVFENVTKLEGLCAFDMFKNNIVIHQGKKKTKIKEWEIIDFEVVEQ